AVPCVLDGGAAEVGIESTIVDLSGAAPRLLRPGWITAEQIAAVLGVPLAAAEAGAPRAPGTLAIHYAPRTPLTLVEDGDLLTELAKSLTQQGRKVAALALSARRPLDPGVIWIVVPREAAHYAHDLYSNLRALDEAGCDAILVERPPQAPEWVAINDRLARAAAAS
ncbi:MAG: translation factor Sua5, partial [Betaproteobacteria bacterium]|nr:translation factor Sua5 [Betaproteobacteria bacterium]